MTVITTRLIVTPDGALRTATPIPAGEHAAIITVADAAARDAAPPASLADFPVDDGPWDDRVSLRREDLYGDNGR